MRNILRGLKITMIVLFLISTEQSFADVKQSDEDEAHIWLYITNTISKNDADYVMQREADFRKKEVRMLLNSPGGDVDAALKIGRIIRNNEGWIIVPETAKCFSSCALIYIAGVRRFNIGTIGLHRPYLASTPHSQQEIERQYPLLLQKIKEYVQSMGVTDSFYQEMVNTEPSNIRLYPGSEIKKLVPDVDPTYDEIRTSHEARKYGITTAEMRRRNMDWPKCLSLYSDVNQQGVCHDAILWGLSDSVFEERNKKQESQCKMSDDDLKAIKEAGRRWRDSPSALKHETCVRNIMLGRQ